MPALEFRDVSFTRPGGTPILQHFDLAVDAGEVVALVGRSGAGKSTHSQTRQPAAGADLRRRSSSKDASTREWEPIRLRRRVGYVLQDVGLFPHMTIAGNIGIVPRLERWTADRTGARVGRAARPDRPRPPSFATGGPTSCPAASASGSASPARSRSIRRFS